MAEPTTAPEEATPLEVFAAIEHELDQSKAELSSLQTRIERLEGALRDASTSTPEVGSSTPDLDASPSRVNAPDEADNSTERPRTTRRGMIKAVGAVSAGAAASAFIKTQPAAAADPNDVVKNTQNNTSDETEIRATSSIASGRNVFLAQSTNYASGSRTAAVSGWAGDNNVYNGVYGYTEGRTADSDTGHGLISNAANGSRSNIYMISILGNPLSSGISHARGELIRDSSGNLWLCTSSGTPGIWRKLAGPSQVRCTCSAHQFERTTRGLAKADRGPTVAAALKP